MNKLMLLLTATLLLIPLSDHASKGRMSPGAAQLQLQRAKEGRVKVSKNELEELLQATSAGSRKLRGEELYELGLLDAPGMNQAAEMDQMPETRQEKKVGVKHGSAKAKSSTASSMVANLIKLLKENLATDNGKAALKNYENRSDDMISKFQKAIQEKVRKAFGEQALDQIGDQLKEISTIVIDAFTQYGNKGKEEILEEEDYKPSAPPQEEVFEEEVVTVKPVIKPEGSTLMNETKIGKEPKITSKTSENKDLLEYIQLISSMIPKKPEDSVNNQVFVKAKNLNKQEKYKKYEKVSLRLNKYLEYRQNIEGLRNKDKRGTQPQFMNALVEMYELDKELITLVNKFDEKDLEKNSDACNVYTEIMQILTKNIQWAEELRWGGGILSSTYNVVHRAVEGESKEVKMSQIQLFNAHAGNIKEMIQSNPCIDKKSPSWFGSFWTKRPAVAVNNEEEKQKLEEEKAAEKERMRLEKEEEKKETDEDKSIKELYTHIEKIAKLFKKDHNISDNITNEQVEDAQSFSLKSMLYKLGVPADAMKAIQDNLYNYFKYRYDYIQSNKKDSKWAADSQATKDITEAYNAAINLINGFKDLAESLDLKEKEDSNSDKCKVYKRAVYIMGCIASWITKGQHGFRQKNAIERVYYHDKENKMSEEKNKFNEIKKNIHQMFAGSPCTKDTDYPWWWGTWVS